ncbi:MAG: peptidoglycan bridge formation glycyltransferase FemA/FemB family protein [Eubacteriales bacterium]|nr:peptidoglycan bridge formation glycyltransferase FemA/FemB family protein [Eubacteriales bacterium]
MFTFTPEIDSTSFDAFMTSHPEVSVTQSSDWARIKTDWSCHRTALYEEDELRFCGLAMIRKVLPGVRLLYMPKGPVGDYSDKKALAEYLAGLQRWARRKKVTVITLDPPAEKYVGPLKTYEDTMPAAANEVIRQFLEAGFIHPPLSKDIDSTVQPRFTMVYEIREGDLKKTYNRNTRSRINRCVNRYVQVGCYGPEGIDDLVRTVRDTEARQGIRLRNRAYFERMMTVYGEDAFLINAHWDVDDVLDKTRREIEEVRQRLTDNPNHKNATELNNRITTLSEEADLIRPLAGHGTILPLATALCIRFGKTVHMLYAGTTNGFERLSAQTAVYHNVFEEAARRGAAFVNLTGISGYFDDGLTQFKRNFYPTVHEGIGEFHAHLQPLRGALYRHAMSIYKKRKQRKHDR